MKEILNILFTFLSIVTAGLNTEVFNGNPVTISWDNWGEDYEYRLKVSKITADSELMVYINDWVEENFSIINLKKEGSYRWEVYIKEKNKDCDDEHQCFLIQTGNFDFYHLEEIVNYEDEFNIEEGQENEAPARTVRITIIPGNHKKEEEKEVLGVEEIDEINNVDNNICVFTYNIDRKDFVIEECSIDTPTISSSTYTKYKELNFVNVEGNYTEEINVVVNNTKCKSFNILEPKTWFKCEEEIFDQSIYTTGVNYTVSFFDKHILLPNNFIFKKDRFLISSSFENLPKEIFFNGNFSVKHRETWLDQAISLKMKVKLEEVFNQHNGIYRFPFDKIIHVNQWHGCTVYQCPHTGIDFASFKEKIYAIGNGEVISVIHKYPKDICRHAGKSVLIRHENGQYSSYMHLDNIFIKSGQKVEKGDIIGISGNSGSYNCQPLGYHLHFELRNSRSQDSHTNPVPYVDINWDLIKTNNAHIFPGRLSGDNPHPNF